MTSEHEIVLFYKYVHIDNPQAVADWQRGLCERLGLKGRIIVATEGINATVEGKKGKTQAYIDEVILDERFRGTHFKRSEGIGHSFPKLSVKVRSEIVSGHFGEEDINPNELTGKRLTAEELHQWLEEHKDVAIVDMRNDYELKVGQFEGTIAPGLENFRDLPGALTKLESLKGKTVVTVCTGGVRCEKASGYLVKNGFKDVYQLDGGIVTYMEKFPNKHFKGKLYVFDGRVVMDFDTPETGHTVIGRCDKCSTPSERYINCAYNLCHRHFICCLGCSEANGEVYCNEQCKEKHLVKA